jgi:cation transport regulator
MSLIRDLSDDEQINLVTLTRLGRGDGDIENRDALRAQAARAHNKRTAAYLLGMPMLADHLEDALSKFGHFIRRSRCRSVLTGDPSSRKPMPYRTSTDLPASVRDHLPPHAQDIYRAAFNHAFAAHAGDIRQEEIAHRTACAAVKRTYVKDGDRWVPIE